MSVHPSDVESGQVHPPTGVPEQVHPPPGQVHPPPGQVYPPPGVPGLRPSSSKDAPPSYQEVTDPNAPPPTYESLYGRVQNARRSASGPWELVQKVFGILIGTLIGTICCTLMLGITLIVPLTLMIIGGVHIHDCPAQPAIPIWLIVGGVVYVLRGTQQALDRARARAAGEDVAPPSAAVNACFGIMQFVWYVLGCVWVYGIQFVSYNASGGPDRYCHFMVYTSAFWLLIFLHIVLMLTVLCGCCVCGVTAATSQQQQQQQQQQSQQQPLPQYSQ